MDHSEEERLLALVPRVQFALYLVQAMVLEKEAPKEGGELGVDSGIDDMENVSL